MGAFNCSYSCPTIEKIDKVEAPTPHDTYIKMLDTISDICDIVIEGLKKVRSINE